MQAGVTALNDWSTNFLVVAQQTEGGSDENVWAGWGSVIFVTSVVAIVAAVVIVLIWQLSKSAQARHAAAATAAQGEAYRQLAEQSASTQESLSTELTALNTTMADLRERVASIEKMMREVE